MATKLFEGYNHDFIIQIKAKLNTQTFNTILTGPFQQKNEAKNKGLTFFKFALSVVTRSDNIDISSSLA